MNKYKLIIFLGAIALLLSSCESIFMKSNPETDGLSIFDEYVTLVTEKYAMLEFKGVDIDQLSDSIRATINADISDADLFEKMSIITLRLRDGHSSLATAGDDTADDNTLFSGYDFTADFDPGIDLPILVDNYIGNAINPQIKLLEAPEGVEEEQLRAIWGTLPQDRDIGYVWIPSWDIEITDEEIETIFSDLKSTKGLIFDQRQNTGGDPSIATKFASFLTDEPVYTGFERFKIGPGQSDFSDSPVTLQPAESSNRYTNPVMVLHDRFVYSAGTTFAYSTNPIDHVTFIGQRSGGGSGSVADGFLANGWHWSLSTSEFIDHENRHLDDGIDPDIKVELDLNDTSKDEVMERAISALQ